MRFTELATAAALVALTCTGAYAGSGAVSQNGNPLTAVLENGSLSTPYLLGALNSTFSSLFVTMLSTGSFTEYATFTVPSGYNQVNGASNTYALSIILPTGSSATIGSISNFGMSVIDGIPGIGTYVEGGVYGPGSSFTLNLIPGNYHLKFDGLVNGVGGQYSATLQAMPVPEPETYAMMLAGLGAVGFIAFRRRRQD